MHRRERPRTRVALRTMEHNAGLGLVLVLLPVWIFLGGRISFYIGIGIAFILAGVFIAIFAIGESLNISVFLGVVIALAAIIGAAMMESGSAQKIVNWLINTLGEKQASVALMISGFILSIPVFFDTGFFLLIPLAIALALKTKRNYVRLFFVS